MGFFNDSFKFECSLDQNTRLPMWEYTLGNKYVDWISLNSNNLQVLVDDTVKKSKGGSKKNPLVIAAPNEGGLARWLQVKHDDKLLIFIYADKSATANKTLVFHSTKQVGSPEFIRWAALVPLPVPVRMFIFEYGSLDVV